MPKKRHKPEEIVAKLRQADVLISQGQSVADAVRAIGVTEVTYYSLSSPTMLTHSQGKAVLNGSRVGSGDQDRPI